MNAFIKGKHTEEEEKCLQEFAPIMESFPKIFSKSNPTEYGVPFDVLTQNHTGGTCVNELKIRYKSYPDMFIEFGKFHTLREIWRNHQILPLYWCLDWETNTWYMWRLNEVVKTTTYLDVWIHPSDGSEPYKGDRIGLSFSEAYKYKYSEKKQKWVLVGKPTSKVTDENEGKVPEKKDDDFLDGKITISNWRKVLNGKQTENDY